MCKKYNWQFLHIPAFGFVFLLTGLFFSCRVPVFFYDFLNFLLQVLNFFVFLYCNLSDENV